MQFFNKIANFGRNLGFAKQIAIEIVKLCLLRDSNPGPPISESGAHTTELSERIIFFDINNRLVGAMVRSSSI